MKIEKTYKAIITFGMILFIMVSISTNIFAQKGNNNIERGIVTIIDEMEAGKLSQGEIDGLLLMREEEKLARDVYTALYEKWNLRAFQSIGQGSETTHMDAMKTLLGRYGLEDPVGEDVPGVFQNEELQKAYDELQAAQDELLRNERLTTLGKFSSMILHDIRNPISVIKAYADMLILSPGDASTDEASKETKYLDKIRFETERLNQLANELLDYSRGEIRLDMGIVSIPDFFREICDFTDHRFTSKDIEVECIHDYDGQVIMDHKRMLRVFANLLENARKALGRQGSCKVSAVQENKMIKFSVRDDGSGMSPEVLDHIFEPFYSSSPNGGTGLGMAIVKSVVEAHHGTVEIESSEGQGTEVLIRMPLRL